MEFMLRKNYGQGTEKTAFFKRLYTIEGLFQLFMICAFPLHLWTLLMAFRDFAWVAARTYTWDAIGLVAYALTFTLAETLAVFLLVVLLGLLIPPAWRMKKRVALIGTLFLVVASWAILSQLYLLYKSPLPGWLLGLLTQTQHPLRVLWGAAFLLVAVSVVAPTFLIARFDNAKDKVIGVFERITVVSSLYVFLDLVGMVIVVIRNIH